MKNGTILEHRSHVTALRIQSIRPVIICIVQYCGQEIVERLGRRADWIQIKDSLHDEFWSCLPGHDGRNVYLHVFNLAS